MQRHVLGHGFFASLQCHFGQDDPTDDQPTRDPPRGHITECLTFTHAIGCYDANFLPPISMEGFWKVVRELRFHNPTMAPGQNELTGSDSQIMGQNHSSFKRIGHRTRTRNKWATALVFT
jgi:hypothetical protein